MALKLFEKQGWCYYFSFVPPTCPDTSGFALLGANTQVCPTCSLLSGLIYNRLRRRTASILPTILYIRFTKFKCLRVLCENFPKLCGYYFKRKENKSYAENAKLI